MKNQPMTPLSSHPFPVGEASVHLRGAAFFMGGLRPELLLHAHQLGKDVHQVAAAQSSERAFSAGVLVEAQHLVAAQVGSVQQHGHGVA